MTETVVVYIGRDNEYQWQLQEDCENIDGDTVTRVVLDIPDHGSGVTLDSDDSPQMISIDSGGVVTATIGTEVDTEGFYDGFLTVYTNTETNGIAWDLINLEVKAWETGA